MSLNHTALKLSPTSVDGASGGGADAGSDKSIKVAIFATHPVQYHVPIWRTLANTPGFDVTVYYFSDHSVRGGIDAGFGVAVAWDIPLLDGYKSVFLSRNANLDQPGTVAIDDAKKLLRDGGYQCVVVQGYTHKFERQVVSAAKKLGIGVAMRGEFSDSSRRSLVKTMVRELYLRWFYSHVDQFCVIGDTARAHLRRFGVTDARMHSSPYAVDDRMLENQIAQLDRTKERQEQNLAPQQVVCLFSGKLISRKEPLLLLEAISHCRFKDRIVLMILGDGELKPKVLELGEKVLGSRFIFRGFVNQSQLGKYFIASDLLVLPSNFETWGLVVNEAMQFGLPVLVSDRVGCHPDLVPQGRSGRVFKSQDALDLAAKLDEMVGDDAARQRMGYEARKIISDYTIGHATEGLAEALKQALPKASGRAV